MCKIVLDHHVNQSWPNQINILGVALKIVIAKIVVLIRANFKNVLITNVTAENVRNHAMDFVISFISISFSTYNYKII